MFQSDEPTLDESLLDESSLPIEDLLAYSRLMAHFPSSPPRPPPRPTNGSTGEEGEEEQKPTYRVIPGVKKTDVTVTFARKALEEFMDRYVCRDRW